MLAALCVSGWDCRLLCANAGSSRSSLKLQAARERSTNRNNANRPTDRSVPSSQEN